MARRDGELILSRDHRRRIVRGVTQSGKWLVVECYVSVDEEQWKVLYAFEE